MVRKLTAEEVADLEARMSGGKAALAEIAAQYDQFLIEFEPNELGEITLEEGERRLNIRNRLKAAAERRGWKLQFIRTTGLVVRFRIVADEATTPSSEQEMRRAA
jgi:hypothetical protein